MGRIALGAAQLGSSYGILNTEGFVGPEVSLNIINHAKRAGVDLIDTAMGYANSESFIGSADISGIKIVTKLPPIPIDAKDVDGWILEQVRGSLHRLNINSLYGLLLHKPSQLNSPIGDLIVNSLLNLKKNGLVQKIGISIYSPEELIFPVGNYDFDLIQAPFNLLDQRLVTSGWMERLENQKIELQVRSIFLQGLLLQASDFLPERFKKWSHLWKKIDEICMEFGITKMQLCLMFALSQPQISKAVVGVNSLNQLIEILNVPFCDLTGDLSSLACGDEALICPINWGSL